MDMQEFVRTFAEDAPVIELPTDGAGVPQNVIVKRGDYAAVVVFLPQTDHLCIDVHPFVAGRDARAGVFGMEQGRRVEAFSAAEAGGTSHGWPAVRMVSVMVGKQS